MTSPGATDAEAKLRSEERDATALFRYTFSDAELRACEALVAGPRSPLSCLPGDPAPDIDSVRAGLEEAGVLWPGMPPRLSGVWAPVFRTLAAARTRLQLLLGTSEQTERTIFYCDGPLANGKLTIAFPVECGFQVSFPASPEDVVDLLLDHLAADDLRPSGGFHEALCVAEYAALLAAKRAGPPFTARALVDAATADPLGALAPWPVELTLESAGQALARLRGRGLLYSLDGVHYEPAPETVVLLASLAAMDRFAAVDFWHEHPGGDLRRVTFAMARGDSRLWLVAFGRDAGGEPAVTLKSVGLLNVRLAIESLIDLSWRES